MAGDMPSDLTTNQTKIIFLNLNCDSGISLMVCTIAAIFS
jgi:hypothetical protein